MADMVFQHVAMECSVCHIPVQRLIHPDGTLEYIHGKPWLTFDHDPDPVPASDSTLRVCDFCSNPKPKWIHTGQSVTLAIPGAQEHKGASWGACDACDVLVRRRNVKALVGRIVAHLPQGHHALTSPEITEHYRSLWLEMHGKFVPTIYKREPAPPPPQPVQPINPSLIPKVRDRLVRFYDGDLARTIFTGGSTPHVMQYPGIDVGEEDVFAVRRHHYTAEHAANLSSRLQRGLQTADLFWVSDRFTVLAVRAGMKLPDTTITREELPLRDDGGSATSGLVVYKQPIGEIDGIKDKRVPVVALGWCLVPNGVWITVYVQPEAVMTGLPREKVRQEVGFLMPASPGGGVVFGTVLTQDNFAVNDTGGIVRTLLATWFLMRQPGVAEVAEGEVAKEVRNSYKHAKRPAPSVRVVDLRKRPRPTPSEHPEPGQRAAWSYRVLVGGDTGGFWRTYWTGPGRAVREQRFIAPYMTGTDDMPLKGDIETVKALR